MNIDPSPYPDETARHGALSRFRSSTFVQNDYFGKIRREFVLNEGGRTNSGIELRDSLFCQGKD